MSRKTREVQEQVAENRNQTRKLDSRFIQVSTQNKRTLSFTRNFIEVDVVEIELYERDLGNSLISGHPDAKHGSGRGISGDGRGGWQIKNVTVSSQQFVRGGRNSVRDALDGQKGAVNFIGVGTGSDDVGNGDDALTSETTKRLCFGIKDSSIDTRARSMPFLFAQYGDTVQEFGTFDGEDRLMARSVLDTPETSSSENELRVDMTFKFSGSGIGDSVITNDGLEAIADAIQLPGTVVGLDEIGFGKGETDPSVTDSALADEVITKGAGRSLDSEKISAVTKLYEGEPSTQPVDFTEVGVFDNNGRLVWRTLIQSFEKTEQFEVSTTVGFNVRST